MNDLEQMIFPSPGEQGAQELSFGQGGQGTRELLQDCFLRKEEGRGCVQACSGFLR